MYDYARWDSMDSKWVVEGQRARDRIEYESFLRDAKKIDAIRKKVDFRDFSQVDKLYSSICTGSIKFESKVGFDFEDEVTELYENLKIINSSSSAKKNKADKKRNTKAKNTNKTVESKKVFIEDDSRFDDEDYDYRSRSDRFSRQSLEDEEDELYGDYIKNHQRVEIRDENVDKELVEYYMDRQSKKKSLFKYLIVGACGLVVLGSFIAVLSKTIADKRSERILQEIEEANRDNAFIFTTINPNSTNVRRVSSDEDEEDYYVNYDIYEIPDILTKYQDSYDKNNDLIGWIKINDTNIDYPVVQCNDNEFYLTHNFKGKNDANGCIFADMYCNVYPRSKNIILYGHHMKSGKMFANLEKYDSYDFYQKHKTFQFDTIYEEALYEVVFVFRDFIHATDDTSFKYYEFVDVTSETEFDSYMTELREKSLYDTNVEVNFKDELLTLSTCDYMQANGRFVIIAKKIR